MAKSKQVRTVKDVREAARRGIQAAVIVEGVAPEAVTVSQFWAAEPKVSEWEIRKLGGFHAVRESLFPSTVSQDDVRKSEQQLAVTNGRQASRIVLANASFEQMVEHLAKDVFKGRISPVKIPKGSHDVERVVNLVLSDLHIGADVRDEETGYQNYGVVEEARRLAALVKQTCTFKSQYRKQSSLVVHILGDVIQGQLHDMRDGAVQAEQFARALHILSQAVAHFAASFSSVNIYCSPGNHGRNTARHKERAVHQKWDAIETMLYVSLSSACSNLKNVQFHIPKTPFVKSQVLEHKMMGTHGDTVLKPGQPNKSIKMEDLEQQINKINASLPDKEEYKVFMMGHVHTPAVVQLDNGAFVIINGCMVPVDQFAVSLGVMESHCGQWIWETIRGHAVGDFRLIKVGAEHDKDAELDKIIAPWKGLPG